MAGLTSKSAVALPFTLSAAFRSLSLSSAKRSFSTTPIAQPTLNLPKENEIPPYPYGPNRWFKQSNTGLYGGVMIHFGNKISKGRNKGKTRRSWKPNVRRKKLWSDALERSIFIKVTHKALRTIYKSGGLDNYLLCDRPARIKELGVFGWRLRWTVMQTPKIRKQFREQREALGLPPQLTFEQWVKEKEEQIKSEVEQETNIEPITRPPSKSTDANQSENA